MAFCFMNEASGTSNIEAKAATGGGERGGSGVSFNTQDNGAAVAGDGSAPRTDDPGTGNGSGKTAVSDRGYKFPNSQRIYVSGKLYPDLRVPFREISLAPTKSMNGEIEVN